MANKRLNILQESLGFVEILKLLKEKYTYKEIAEKVHLAVPTLNRYAKGQVLPAANKTKELLQVFRELFDLKEELKKRIDETGDYTSIFTNPSLMKLIALDVYMHYQNNTIDKVFTAPIDGLPIATFIAHVFGASVAYTRFTREHPIEEYIEEAYRPAQSNRIQSFYLQKNIFKKNENVLIVDDMIKTSATLNALVHLAKRCEVKIKGIFVVLSEDGGLRKIEDKNIPIYTLIEA